MAKLTWFVMVMFLVGFYFTQDYVKIRNTLLKSAGRKERGIQSFFVTLLTSNRAENRQMVQLKNEKE